ncbi:RidA family protein [Mesorhizobium sp. B2-3-4]|uniref:RidA family protein n=1 Tax=Mesorhizobium sp. B2-3-4 TaxID=2589959 RepID=UPI00112ACCB6|nr:RidA family protein [Mesorhizobium sp. B2-3-4]TPM40542.1 RidA family protein [Mesorhizobium sp. B2-3-4]
MKRKITAEGVAVPGAPFASAIAVEGGRTVYTSGFLARDSQTGTILHKGDAEKQSLVCFDKIEKILEAEGGTLQDIVKMTVFLRDVTDYEAMNRARKARLAGIDYASSTVIAGLAAADGLVEIECVAAIGGSADR